MVVLSQPEHRAPTGFGAVAAALLAAGVCSAAEPSPDPCAELCTEGYPCLQAQAECLVGADRAREAITSLKGACAATPGDGELVRLLAWAYLRSGNEAWARKRLLEQIEAVPGDAQSRAWAVWLLVQGGSVGQARRLLDAAPPAERVEDRQRFEILDVALLQLEVKPDEARSTLTALPQADDLYPEDRSLLADLRRQVLGDRGEPWSVRVDLSGGYASNVIESAPQDMGSGGDGGRAPRAPIAGLDAVLRFEPWTSPGLRPTGELRGKGFSPFTDDAEGFGYYSVGARGGLELGPADGRRARLLYSAELMGLRGDEEQDELAAGLNPVEGGPAMEAHRGDLELDLTPGVQAFAGAGRRIYREIQRTHTEIDGGGAWVLPFAGGWNLTSVVTGRYHLARHPAWNAWGLTGLVRLRVPLPGEHMLKLRGMVLWDRWPEFGAWEPSVEQRNDLAARLQVGPWTRDVRGWRVGLTYNLATRASSLDAYDYTDHRALLELRWQRGWNPGLPPVAELAEPRLPLPYGLQEGGDQGLDRVQDLLRQEDSARRGSSCVD